MQRLGFFLIKGQQPLWKLYDTSSAVIIKTC